jgi:hypothetical protein
MSATPLTQQRLTDAVTAVLPAILEKLRPYYDPPQPLEDFHRTQLGYTDERNLREHIEFCDSSWSRELKSQAGVLAQSLYKSEDDFKAHLVTWLTADRTGCNPLSYGTLHYLLADALVDELSIRGEISQRLPREGGRQP